MGNSLWNSRSVFHIMPYSNSPRKSPRKHGSESLEKNTETRMTKTRMNKHLYSIPHPTWKSLRFCTKKVDLVATRRPQKVQRSVKVGIFGMMGWYLEDGLAGGWTDMWWLRITRFVSPFKGHEWKGNNPKLGDLLTLTMVINHLLNRMMLQGRRPW